VVTLGAWAGIEAGNAAESAAPADAVIAALPAARPAPRGVTSEPTVAEPRPRTLAQRRIDPVSFASLRTKRATPVDEVPSAEPAAARAPRHRYYETMAADGTTEIAVEELAKSDAAPAQAVAAALPLSNSTIARTIHHIGYGCGQVTSTIAVEGGSGVYKVTCASGQSYRAAPVRGRYHFRRWSE
jgi:hypothetical protein